MSLHLAEAGLRAAFQPASVKLHLASAACCHCSTGWFSRLANNFLHCKSDKRHVETADINTYIPKWGKKSNFSYCSVVYMEFVLCVRAKQPCSWDPVYIFIWETIYILRFFIPSCEAEISKLISCETPSCRKQCSLEVSKYKPAGLFLG